MDTEFYDNWDDYIRFLTPEACEHYVFKVHKAMTKERLFQVFDELATDILYDYAKQLSFWKKLRILFRKKPFVL